MKGKEAFFDYANFLNDIIKDAWNGSKKKEYRKRIETAMKLDFNERELELPTATQTISSFTVKGNQLLIFDKNSEILIYDITPKTVKLSQLVITNHPTELNSWIYKPELRLMFTSCRAIDLMVHELGEAMGPNFRKVMSEELNLNKRMDIHPELHYWDNDNRVLAFSGVREGVSEDDMGERLFYAELDAEWKCPKMHDLKDLLENSLAYRPGCRCIVTKIDGTNDVFLYADSYIYSPVREIFELKRVPGSGELRAKMLFQFNIQLTGRDQGLNMDQEIEKYGAVGSKNGKLVINAKTEGSETEYYLMMFGKTNNTYEFLRYIKIPGADYKSKYLKLKSNSLIYYSRVAEHLKLFKLVFNDDLSDYQRFQWNISATGMDFRGYGEYLTEDCKYMITTDLLAGKKVCKIFCEQFVPFTEKDQKLEDRTLEFFKLSEIQEENKRLKEKEKAQQKEEGVGSRDQGARWGGRYGRGGNFEDQDPLDVKKAIILKDGLMDLDTPEIFTPAWKLQRVNLVQDKTLICLTTLGAEDHSQSWVQFKQFSFIYLDVTKPERARLMAKITINTQDGSEEERIKLRLNGVSFKKGNDEDLAMGYQLFICIDPSLILLPSGNHIHFITMERGNEAENDLGVTTLCSEPFDFENIILDVKQVPATNKIVVTSMKHHFKILEMTSRPTAEKNNCVVFRKVEYVFEVPVEITVAPGQDLVTPMFIIRTKNQIFEIWKQDRSQREIPLSKAETISEDHEKPEKVPKDTKIIEGDFYRCQQLDLPNRKNDEVFDVFIAHQGKQIILRSSPCLTILLETKNPKTKKMEYQFLQRINIEQKFSITKAVLHKSSEYFLIMNKFKLQLWKNNMSSVSLVAEIASMGENSAAHRFNAEAQFVADSNLDFIYTLNSVKLRLEDSGDQNGGDERFGGHEMQDLEARRQESSEFFYLKLTWLKHNFMCKASFSDLRDIRNLFVHKSATLIDHKALKKLIEKEIDPRDQEECSNAISQSYCILTATNNCIKLTNHACNLDPVIKKINFNCALITDPDFNKKRVFHSKFNGLLFAVLSRDPDLLEPCLDKFSYSDFFFLGKKELNPVLAAINIKHQDTVNLLVQFFRKNRGLLYPAMDPEIIMAGMGLPIPSCRELMLEQFLSQASDVYRGEGYWEPPKRRVIDQYYVHKSHSNSKVLQSLTPYIDDRLQEDLMIKLRRMIQMGAEIVTVKALSTKVAINYKIYSKSCRNLLLVIRDLPDDVILGEIRYLIKYIWSFNTIYILFFALMQSTTLVLFMISSVWHRQSIAIYIPLQVLSSIQIFTELLVMVMDTSEYLGNLANWMDLAIYSSIPVISSLNFFEVIDITRPWTNFAVNLFLMLAGYRMIGVLQIFTLIRYLIAMINQVFLDMRGFTVVIALTILIFGVINIHVGETIGEEYEGLRTFGVNFDLYYNFMFGNWDSALEYNAAQYSLYLISGVFIGLIMTNLVIGIISQTFTDFQEMKDLVDLRQVVVMLIEFSYVVGFMVGYKEDDPDDERKKYLMLIFKDDGDKTGQMVEHFKGFIDEKHQEMKGAMEETQKEMRETNKRLEEKLDRLIEAVTKKAGG